MGRTQGPKKPLAPLPRPASILYGSKCLRLLTTFADTLEIELQAFFGAYKSAGDNIILGFSILFLENGGFFFQ